MNFIEFLRKRDVYGAPVSLNYKGKRSFQTIGGAEATILLRILILIYFCKQLIQVIDYDDPQISSYEVFEDRGDMENPLALGDSKVDFIVGFMNQVYVPVAVDPRYGKFELINYS